MGWACRGVSEDARLQSQAQVNLGRSQYADEHNLRAALESLERAVRLDPENAEAHLVLGHLYGVQALWERAQSLLERSVELYVRDAAEDERARSPLAEARNHLAQVYINRGRFDDAIALERLVTTEVLYDAQHLAWGNLGLAYLRKGDLTQAVEALSRAVQIQPQFCVGRYRLGEAYYRQEDYAHALEALNAALSTPQEACQGIQAAYLVRGQVRVRLHQPDEAREDLARCVALAADTPEGRLCAELGRSVAVGP
ncbi:MAG: tetratricopeptide repeat protein [Deltaproteobacteria bacterium]|nr:tetratricopeptide repeat protein [Deltaproteobacteria bacterium]